jgi:hypothetical protein
MKEKPIPTDLEHNESRRHVDSSDESSSNAALSSEPTSSNHTLTVKSDTLTKVSLTHEESRAVRRTKLLVFAVLFLSAIGIGYATYALLEQELVDDYTSAVRRKMISRAENEMSFELGSP